MLGGSSDDDGGDSGVFVLLLAEYDHLATTDLAHLDSVFDWVEVEKDMVRRDGLGVVKGVGE